jgi:hypothetical protein
MNRFSVGLFYFLPSSPSPQQMPVTASQSVKASETRTDRMIANARASPPCDAQMPRLTSVESGQGLPGQMRARPKKLARGPLGCAQVKVRMNRYFKCGVDDREG